MVHKYSHLYDIPATGLRFLRYMDCLADSLHEAVGLKTETSHGDKSKKFVDWHADYYGKD